ncbi:MAG TPA: CatB-related O-acetyltransferase [Jatrophihabitans sp.]
MSGIAARLYHRARGAHVAPTARVPLRSRLSRHTSIGANTFVNGPACCKGGGSIAIGPHCAIGEGLLVTTTNHDTRHANMMLRMHWQHGFVDLDAADDVRIGPACWIGDRVTVLGGANIGTGVVIAAGSVVTRGDYPDYSIVAGVPARVLRRRADPEVAATLVDAQWWDWPDDRVARNREFFETDISVTDPGRLRETIVQ